MIQICTPSRNGDGWGLWPWIGFGRQRKIAALPTFSNQNCPVLSIIREGQLRDRGKKLTCQCSVWDKVGSVLELPGRNGIKEKEKKRSSFGYFAINRLLKLHSFITFNIASQCLNSILNWKAVVFKLYDGLMSNSTFWQLNSISLGEGLLDQQPIEVIGSVTHPSISPSLSSQLPAIYDPEKRVGGQRQELCTQYSHLLWLISGSSITLEGGSSSKGIVSLCFSKYEALCHLLLTTPFGIGKSWINI